MYSFMYSVVDDLEIELIKYLINILLLNYLRRFFLAEIFEISRGKITTPAGSRNKSHHTEMKINLLTNNNLNGYKVF